MSNPFLYGKDSSAKLYVGNPPTPVQLWSKKIHVQEKANVVWDPVCGEIRSRPIKITDGFTATIDTFDDLTGNYLRMWINAQANDDAGNPPLGLGLGLVFKGAGGVMVCVFSGIMCLDPLDYSIEGRTAANMAQVKINSQFFNEGPGVSI